MPQELATLMTVTVTSNDDKIVQFPSSQLLAVHRHNDMTNDVVRRNINAPVSSSAMGPYIKLRRRLVGN